MTYEDLKNYLGMKAEVQAINDEIDYWETYVITVKYEEKGGSSGHESNPTKQAVDHLIELRERLATKKDLLVQRTLEIEEWIDSLQDKEVSAIIRYHFIMGKTWRETTKKVYGYADWSLSQWKIRNHFGLTKLKDS